MLIAVCNRSVGRLLLFRFCKAPSLDWPPPAKGYHLHLTTMDRATIVLRSLSSRSTALRNSALRIRTLTDRWRIAA